jgi:hypothetical protein
MAFRKFKSDSPMSDMDVNLSGLVSRDAGYFASRDDILSSVLVDKDQLLVINPNP